MTKTLKILAVTALAQLLLIAFSVSSGPQLHSQGSGDRLFRFNKTDIDQLVIDAADGKQTVLSRKQKQWQTADAFPANKQKLESLLDTLGALKTGLPVATSEAALSRFKVARDDFERHILLKKGDTTLADLYIGSGAGARQSHIRRADQQAVYTAAIGNYDLPVKTEDWQDKNLLVFDKNSVTSMTMDGLAVQREPPSSHQAGDAANWRMENLAANKVLDQHAIDAALTQLSNLHFSKVLGKESKAEYGMNKATLNISIVYPPSKRQYRFGKIKDSGDYALKTSDRDEYFKITAGAGTALITKFSKDKWLTEKTSAEDKTATEKDENAKAPTQTPPE